MEDGAADSDHRDGSEQKRIIDGEGEPDKAGQGERHSGRQQERHRPPVGGKADQRLQQRGGALEHESDDAGLEESQRHLVAEHWVESGGANDCMVSFSRCEALTANSTPSAVVSTAAFRSLSIRPA